MEDQEKIKKHAKKLEKKEPVELEKRLEIEKNFRQSIETEAGVIENAFGGVEVDKVVEKEPLEKRSEVLEEENPKSSPKFSSKSDIRGPNSTTKSIVVKRAENSRSLTSNCSKVP